jgi:hypothetical protein
MAKMTPDEILAKSTNRSMQDAQKVRSEMAYLVNTDPNFRVMRSGNTLFSYYNRKNGNVDIAMDTAATPRELIKDISEFVKAMKLSKFKHGKFDINNPQIERILRMANVKYKLMTQPNGRMSGIMEF